MSKIGCALLAAGQPAEALGLFPDAMSLACRALDPRGDPGAEPAGHTQLQLRPAPTEGRTRFTRVHAQPVDGLLPALPAARDRVLRRARAPGS